MGVPFKPKFDNFAQVSFGLVAFGLGPLPHANGVALVTGFIFAENWAYCSDQVVTAWTLCSAPVTTPWTDNDPSVTTTWSVIG